MVNHENLIKGLHELYLDLFKQGKKKAVITIFYGNKEVTFTIVTQEKLSGGKESENKK